MYLKSQENVNTPFYKLLFTNLRNRQLPSSADRCLMLVLVGLFQVRVSYAKSFRIKTAHESCGRASLNQVSQVYEHKKHKRQESINTGKMAKHP